MALSLNKPKLDNLAGDIWKSAERLRGKFKAYEYQGVILPIVVIRRLERVLLKWREAKRAEVLAKRPKLSENDFSLFVTGAAQPKLTMENLGRFKLVVPRVAEQKEIAAFIREKETEFRPLFAQIERRIETLVACRKSLIHECVTGQRRITETDVQRASAQRRFDNPALTG